jgi:hypothetical protein
MFDDMSERFNAAFRLYLLGHQAGMTQDTPAQRARAAAEGSQRVCAEDMGTELTCWFLAIALERLVALETSGIPT